MWTAKILSKKLVSGLLRIRFQFTNGTETFEECYDTHVPQGSGWLNDLIYERLGQLNNIDDMLPTIPVGDYVPTAHVYDPVDTPRELYQVKLALYYRMVEMISVGVIMASNTDYVALKLWLKNNFIANYNTLFETGK